MANIASRVQVQICGSRPKRLEWNRKEPVQLQAHREMRRKLIERLRIGQRGDHRLLPEHRHENAGDTSKPGKTGSAKGPALRWRGAMSEQHGHSDSDETGAGQQFETPGQYTQRNRGRWNAEFRGFIGKRY